MTTDRYNIDPNLINESKDAMTGGGVTLPFSAPFIWWSNGKALLKEQNDVRYHGGWVVDAADLGQVMNDFGLSPPYGFVETPMVSNTGDAYDTYTSRVVLANFIGMRKKWVERRSHVHWLVYLASLGENKEYEPWGAAVLSAKGMSSLRIEDAITRYQNETNKIRGEVTSGLPPWYFYIPLGTHGAEPIIEMVGKAPNTSPINPCQVILPKSIDQAFIERAFIGQEMAKAVSDLRSEAQPWLAAWDEGAEATERTEQPGQEYGEFTSPYGEVRPTEEEDIPF